MSLIYPIPSTVDQKCLGKNTNQLQGKNTNESETGQPTNQIPELNTQLVCIFT